MTSLQITDPREPMDQPITEKSTISLGFVAAIIVWVVTVVLAYSSLDKRISANEDKMLSVTHDVTEIKSDVKTLLRNQ